MLFILIYTDMNQKAFKVIPVIASSGEKFSLSIINLHTIKILLNTMYFYASFTLIVFCLKAGPWHPCSPLYSVSALPFITTCNHFLKITNHPQFWSSPNYLSIYSTFNHLFQQPFSFQYKINPTFLSFVKTFTTIYIYDIFLYRVDQK